MAGAVTDGLLHLGFNFVPPFTARPRPSTDVARQCRGIRPIAGALQRADR